ncbi:MAG: 3'-5' exonuclease, partial [Bacteroidales bacterium]|nr:3'-5' exonuclease [Bacteroidales bacterium]
AATEFKKRLLVLIGNAAHYIEIKTFHSYCFDLLGKVGSLDKSDTILKTTIEKIKNGEVEANRITKTVLVIDEAQDMNADEFALITTLMEQNEEMRVIAVGDDDQNIYEFRGSSSGYLKQFMTESKAARHELIENYRSKNNLVEFTNGFVKKIRHRLKETPIAAKQTDNGHIKLVHYQNGNLISALVQDILSTGLAGTTCVLTKTNDEALQITGLLLKNGMQAKLIQSNDGFGLQNLAEVRFLLNEINLGDEVKMVSDEVWADAKSGMRKKFQHSSKLEVCNNLIKLFEESNSQKKYKSDFEVFVRESKLEDFYSGSGETIFVSTIHKAKGKEFENVFIMLEDFSAASDEAKRQLYVAMTRAKRNLIIHLNGNFLNNITAENLERVEDREERLLPKEMAMHLSFRDVWLDYFITRQHLVSQLTSGDTLTINSDECRNSKGQSVLKFSRQFLNTIETQKQKGFYLKQAKVNFVVYWKKEDAAQESKIILPELIFERQDN